MLPIPWVEYSLPTDSPAIRFDGPSAQGTVTNPVHDIPARYSVQTRWRLFHPEIRQSRLEMDLFHDWGWPGRIRLAAHRIRARSRCARREL